MRSLHCTELTRERFVARGDAGYTLLEVLIALAIMGLTIAALVGHVQFGARLYEQVRSETEIQPWEAGLLVAENLLRDARQLHGDADSLSFVSHMPHSLEAPGLYFVELRAAPSGGLTLSSRSRADGPRTAAEGHLDRLPLVEAPGRVRFAFYDGALRRSSWRSQRREPNVVEISIQFEDGSERATRVAPIFARF